jgi:hypothetical protein
VPPKDDQKPATVVGAGANESKISQTAIFFNMIEQVLQDYNWWFLLCCQQHSSVLQILVAGDDDDQAVGCFLGFHRTCVEDTSSMLTTQVIDKSPQNPKPSNRMATLKISFP